MDRASRGRGAPSVGNAAQLALISAGSAMVGCRELKGLSAKRANDVKDVSTSAATLSIASVILPACPKRCCSARIQPTAVRFGS